MIETELMFILLTFLGGFISFFSLSVVPLILIYFGYLVGNGQAIDCYGKTSYIYKKVIFNILFFILGILVAFFILSISFSSVGDINFDEKNILSKIGSTIIIFLGIFQLNIIKVKFLAKEKKVGFIKKEVSPVFAFIVSFTFVYAWKSFVGPVLSSILILAMTLENRSIGSIMILIYSLGFVFPLILLGMGAIVFLNLIKTKQIFLNYINKLGGIILIIIGTIIFIGYQDKLSNYLEPIKLANYNSEETKIENNEIESNSFFNNESYKLIDQYNKEHILSEYEGKVIFLNFWATWCPSCVEEIPYIEELYKEYGYNEKEVVILGITNPVTIENIKGQDIKIDDIKLFLSENNFTFPTVFDKTGVYFDNFDITAFPTTIIVGRNGEIKDIVSGALNKEQMIYLIERNF